MFVDMTVRKRMLLGKLIMAAERSCNTGLLLRTFAQISTILNVNYLQTYKTLDNHLKTNFNLHYI